METEFARLRRLWRQDQEHAQALYGWRHPYNVERRQPSYADEVDSLRARCRRLEDRLRIVDELLANRQRDADEADETVADERHEDDRHDEQGHEPLVIRRRGGPFHAK